MFKFIMHIVELYILLRIVIKATRFLAFRKFGKKRGKSIPGKIALLISNRIHFELDHLIKAQKVKRLAGSSQQTYSNVIPFKTKRYKKAR